MAQVLKKIPATKLFLLLVAFSLCTAVIYNYVPVYSHWAEIFRPAALNLLHGQSPYQIENFFNPPWALLPLLPLAILPIRLGNAILGTLTLFSYAFVGYKFGAKPIILLLFLSLPLTLYAIIQVNVDWLMALGFIMPPQIGLFFILVKPQLGWALAFYWLIDIWTTAGLTKTIKVFAPVTVTFLLSFLIFGNYWDSAGVVFNEPNKSFWPVSIPVGMVVLFLAFRLKHPGLAIASSPLLSPYVQPYSLPLAILGLMGDWGVATLLIVGLWFIFLDPSRSYIFQRLLAVFK